MDGQLVGVLVLALRLQKSSATVRRTTMKACQGWGGRHPWGRTAVPTELVAKHCCAMRTKCTGDRLCAQQHTSSAETPGQRPGILLTPLPSPLPGPDLQAQTRPSLGLETWLPRAAAIRTHLIHALSAIPSSHNSCSTAAADEPEVSSALLDHR